VLTGIILFIFSDFRRNTDKEIESFFIKVRGELTPDTNIVLIHFSAEDIERLGPWPIKRSYYALLINQLSNLGVKKIGMEIFLSSRLVTQSVYDNLLEKEIEKSGKVILSSLAGQISRKNIIYYTDSLSFPSPRLLNEEILTGHINFIKDYDYEIPLVLNNDGIKEKAFSLQLTDKEPEQTSILVNFVSSWEKIKKYSALEFTKMVFNKSDKLKNFKNKVVIIGVSDNQMAPTFQTQFDYKMPGIAFHAFALDNIVKSRTLNADLYNLSLIILPLLIIGFIFFRHISDRQLILKYLGFGLLILLSLFLLSSIAFYKISHSAFVMAFLFLVISDIMFYSLVRKKILRGAVDEAIVLRNLLLSKENELEILQEELKDTGKESEQLLDKIDVLKKDIEKLKENEDDRIEIQIKPGNETKEFYGLVYKSNSMSQLVELIQKVAPTDSTILITGESGTGKELVAKAIHQLSKRNEKNFVAINCGALTDSLLESELFGYVRGAFTGANSDKMGRFELADKGTIFLDEIGETSENFQVKMLRVLQSGEIEKVGSAKTEIVNVRVIAATNKNLSQLVKEKTFREDLYYRLNVITIELPPLRERKEDIDALINSFLESEDRDLQISKAALQALNEYQWKGNVRELESVIKRAVIFAMSDKRSMLRLSDLPKELIKGTSYNFEDLVLDSLREKKFSHSSISETAKELGNVNRTLVAEHLRGIALKTIVETNFDLESSVEIISNSNEEEVNKRVLSKIQTFINNIENDLVSLKNHSFDDVKTKLSAKYKNLPAKFHIYLDDVIQRKLNNLQK
jgi:transcriptional regulator with GAF, ATPase, and Fis domain/CHASE2 domain-containing sensor protein